MALSDNDLTKKQESKRRRPVKADTNLRWSDSQKIEAVQTYLALGKITLAAAVLKIPEVTLRNWKSKQWWKDIEQELRVQDDLVLSSRLQNLINKSLETVQDRLENGDFIYDNRTGKLVRKPVAMREAHRVAMDMVDKREHLINKVPATQTVDAVEDKLNKLAEKFAQIAQGINRPVIEVTDVIEVNTNPQEEDIEDALYEERQEGLQEGI